MKEKSEIQSIITRFCKLIHTQFRMSIKSVCSNNDGEFLGLKDFFHANGIEHQTNIPYTPQKNCRVEGKHRHILNVAQALLFQSNLPITFWGDCVLTIRHLINRTSSTILKRKTPFALLYGTPPDYTLLCTFGCLCYTHNVDSNKLKPHSRKCIFIGYPHGECGWHAYDLESREFSASKDMVFHECIFPSSSKTSAAEMHFHERQNSPQLPSSTTILSPLHPNSNILSSSSSNKSLNAGPEIEIPHPISTTPLGPTQDTFVLQSTPTDPFS